MCQSLFSATLLTGPGPRNRFVDHFTRLEVFGDPDFHWVRVMVDPADPGLFTIRPEIIPENKGR